MLARVDESSEVETIVYTFLAERFPALTMGNPDAPMLESGAIDSLGVLELMMFLGDHFGITLDDSDFDLANLGTPARLVKFIERKRC